MSPLLKRFRHGFAENARFAIAAIRDHKLRASLTVLGIVVGVTTVIAMVAIISGFNNNVIGTLQAFGASRIEFQKYEDRFGPGGPAADEEKRRRNLTVADAEAIRELVPEARTVLSRISYDGGVVHVKHGNLEANLPYVMGTDENYPVGMAYPVSHGRFYNATEVAHCAPVIVLGADVREAIFPDEDPLGKDVTVNGARYRVVGVLYKKGEQLGYSPDNKVLLPFGTFERQFSSFVRDNGVIIGVLPRDPKDLQLVIDQATEVLRHRRKVPFNKPNDFAINTPDQLIAQFKAITGGVTGAMVFIALISLIIGGVGVMNIMLATVTERTREIGVRRAVGALRRDIVGQFLTEAVTLSSIGGVIGIALGLAAAAIVRATVPSLPTDVPLWSPLVGLAVSMGVGIVFGLWPAVKASRLDPVEALRYE
ncbi:MAG: ABC transporter permease [Thermoanaerobaculales bacterium]